MTNKIFVITTTLILLFMASACGMGVYPPNPITSKIDLENSNMYAYMLSESTLIDRGWTVEVVPFQFRCEFLAENVFQPLFINYYDKNGDFVLAIRISDDDAFVSPTEPDGYFDLDFGTFRDVWFEYRQSSNLQLYFEDINGLDVVIETTTLSLDELKTVIQSLEQVGEVSNPTIPWRDTCE